jgi:hypothetical protein
MAVSSFTLKGASVFPTLKGVELSSAKLLGEGKSDKDDEYEEEKPKAEKDTLKEKEKNQGKGLNLPLGQFSGLNLIQCIIFLLAMVMKSLCLFIQV